MADFQMNVRFQRYQLIMQYSQYYQFFQQYPGDPFGLRSQLDQIAATLTNSQSLGSNVLDHMIEDVMIANEAAKRGITVTDDELNKLYQQVFGYFPDGTPTPTVTPTEITQSTLNPTQLAIVTVTPTVPVTPTRRYRHRNPWRRNASSPQPHPLHRRGLKPSPPTSTPIWRPSISPSRLSALCSRLNCWARN